MKGEGPRFDPPKTPASYRTVPLPQTVADALAAHLATEGPGDDGLIFSTVAGDKIRRTRFSDDWRPDVAASTAPEGTRFHDLLGPSVRLSWGATGS